jgi:hypothetical protein
MLPFETRNHGRFNMVTEDYQKQKEYTLTKQAAGNK